MYELNVLRKWCRKLAAWFVRLWARYNFSKARKKADALYRKRRTMIYVCSQPFHEDVLTLYDRDRFKMEKKAWGYSGLLLTLQSMKYGCYYHTPDRAGNQKMTDEEVKERLEYFTYERLAAAGLIRKRG